jgi:long-chain acyl-CoA synthetase
VTLMAAVLTQPISAQELAARGLIPVAEGERLSNMVGANAVVAGCQSSSEELAKEAEKLNREAAVVQAVLKEVAAAQAGTEQFREHERVKGVHLLLEPMTVPNGLLTQTLKMRRNLVAERHAASIARMFA